MIKQLIRDIEHKEYLVFDFDLTIARVDIDWTQWHPGVSRIYSNYNRDHGYVRGVNPHDFYNQMAKKYGEELTKEIREFNARYENEFVTGFTPYPDLVNLIKEVKNKHLYIYSSNSRKTISKGLEDFGLLDHFEQIISRDDLIFLKPNPEGFGLIPNFATHKDSFVMIGDSSSDEMAAQNAGINFIKVDYFETYKY